MRRKGAPRRKAGGRKDDQAKATARKRAKVKPPRRVRRTDLDRG